MRDCDFYPSSLEKGIRSERALKLALAEMYVQGVSTRKVAAVTEQLCGFQVSSSQVSMATAELDEQLQAWRERPLGHTRYLYLDARYEKVRQDGQVRNSAVLLAVGVNNEACPRVRGGWESRSAGSIGVIGRTRGSLAQLPSEPGFPWSEWNRTHHQR